MKKIISIIMIGVITMLSANTVKPTEKKCKCKIKTVKKDKNVYCDETIFKGM